MACVRARQLIQRKVGRCGLALMYTRGPRGDLQRATVCHVVCMPSRRNRSKGAHILPVRECWHSCQWVHTDMHVVAVLHSHTCSKMNTVSPRRMEEWLAFMFHGRPVVLSLAPAAGTRVPFNCAAPSLACVGSECTKHVTSTASSMHLQGPR